MWQHHLRMYVRKDLRMYLRNASPFNLCTAQQLWLENHARKSPERSSDWIQWYLVCWCLLPGQCLATRILISNRELTAPGHSEQCWVCRLYGQGSLVGYKLRAIFLELRCQSPLSSHLFLSTRFFDQTSNHYARNYCPLSCRFHLLGSYCDPKCSSMGVKRLD